MASFRESVEMLLKNEGGYTKHDTDQQGNVFEANFGITKKTYPDLDIKALTREEAIAIYRRDFWGPIRGDAMPQAVADAMLDYAANSNVWQAVTDLQRVVGHENLEVDGNFGSITAKSLRDTLKFATPEEVGAALNRNRLRLFQRLVTQNPQRARELPSWQKRVTRWEKKYGVSFGPQPPSDAEITEQALALRKDKFNEETP